MRADWRETEAQFQRAVIDAARLFGWRVHAQRTALRQSGRYSTPIQGDAGFPDLVLARGQEVVFAELKSEDGRLRPGQPEWLLALGDAPGHRTVVWRPSDWPEIEETLR